MKKYAMVKVNRFVYEYAAYKKREQNEKYITENCIDAMQKTIDEYVTACECGLISINECMEKLTQF